VLELPATLNALIARGAWPLTETEANRQNLMTGPIPRAVVERHVPGESSLYLFWPPFSTIAQVCARNERGFWSKFGALEQIDPERALLIGDFGLGSDTAIVLDYRRPNSPPLLRLTWTATATRTRWVPFFDTFAAFAGAFDLEHRCWR
jgi:hypothetical protein